VHAQRLVRSIGLKNASAGLVRRPGGTQVAIYIDVGVAETLDVALPKALAKFGLRLAKTDPEAFAPLAAAGWKVRAG
jgi:hypothetical protein